MSHVIHNDHCQVNLYKFTGFKYESFPQREDAGHSDVLVSSVTILLKLLRKSLLDKEHNCTKLLILEKSRNLSVIFLL